MKVTTFDVYSSVSVLLVCFLVIALGGVYHPNTLAGAVARFVFSLS